MFFFPNSGDSSAVFVFQGLGLINLESFLRFFPLVFSLAGCLSPGPWPRGYTQHVLCRDPSSQLRGQLQRAKEGACLRHNHFKEGETESDGVNGERLGKVGSF